MEMDERYLGLVRQCPVGGALHPNSKEQTAMEETGFYHDLQPSVLRMECDDNNINICVGYCRCVIVLSELDSLLIGCVFDFWPVCCQLTIGPVVHTVRILRYFIMRKKCRTR